MVEPAGNEKMPLAPGKLRASWPGRVLVGIQLNRLSNFEAMACVMVNLSEHGACYNTQMGHIPLRPVPTNTPKQAILDGGYNGFTHEQPQSHRLAPGRF